MSALQYKSKIKTPGVELGNEVVLTSPTTGRLNLGAKTETNHTRDNDVLTFDNLVNCKIELLENDQVVGTGGGTNTYEMLSWTIERTAYIIPNSNNPTIFYIVLDSVEDALEYQVLSLLDNSKKEIDITHSHITKSLISTGSGYKPAILVVVDQSIYEINKPCTMQVKFTCKQ